MLARGYDVWMMDADLVFKKSSSHTSFACVQEARRIGIDVFGQKDVKNKAEENDPTKPAYMNFGRVWTRSTPGTIAMATRVYNRTFGAWDQFIWNQEMDGAETRCCDLAWMNTFLKKPKTKGVKKEKPRQECEPRARKAAYSFPTLGAHLCIFLSQT